MPTRSQPLEGLLSPEEVGLFLGIPVKTLYAWKVRGQGPKPLRVGRHLRYRREDVESWLEHIHRGVEGEMTPEKFPHVEMDEVLREVTDYLTDRTLP